MRFHAFRWPKPSLWAAAPSAARPMGGILCAFCALANWYRDVSKFVTLSQRVWGQVEQFRRDTFFFACPSGDFFDWQCPGFCSQQRPESEQVFPAIFLPPHRSKVCGNWCLLYVAVIVEVFEETRVLWVGPLTHSIHRRLAPRREVRQRLAFQRFRAHLLGRLRPGMSHGCFGRCSTGSPWWLGHFENTDFKKCLSWIEAK